MSNPFEVLSKKRRGSKKEKDKEKEKEKEKEPEKHKLNPIQRSIIEQRKAAQLAKKNCFFYAQCGGKKESGYSYCAPCYKTLSQPCHTDGCTNTCRLSNQIGIYHQLCDTCRHPNKK